MTWRATRWLPIRGACCEWGGCVRRPMGYVNDGSIDKHLCHRHWNEYHQRPTPPQPAKEAAQ